MTILSALGGRSRLPVIVGVTLVAIVVTYGLIVGALGVTP
jgi:hypothetical protein